jgi:ABC-type lipoprotein release transport system permease subunit
MGTRAFVNFLFLVLHRHRASHVGIFLLGTMLAGILAAVLMLTRAVQDDLHATLAAQPDIVVQQVRGGKQVDLPGAWAEDFALLPGVRAAVPRVFGRYFHEPNGVYFTVLGVDFFAEAASADLGALIDGLDLRAFLAEPSLVAGAGVRHFLDQNFYTDSYTFKTPQAASVEVKVMATLPETAGLVGHDLVIMDIDLARQILGVAPDRATDIALSVPNELATDAVMGKLIQMHYDIRVIQKKELATAYDNLFNFKGGVFLLLWLVSLAAFVLVLYQRYSRISGDERREIGILRATGWSIGQVINLKLAENAVVGISAWLLGTCLGYGYVFFLQAPGLAQVFMGAGNLPPALPLTPNLAVDRLVLLFLFYLVPYLAAVLVPVWKLAVTEPVEVMK